MIPYDDWLEQEEVAVIRIWSIVLTVASFLAGITVVFCWML